MKYAVVVLGMHRSGTSAMARVLALSGLALPKELMPAHPQNPTGFWESQRVADLNDEILSAQDAKWDDVFPVGDEWVKSEFGAKYLAKAAEALQADFADRAEIVLKDPRFSVLTRFWARALKEAAYEPKFVVMVRNPLEVAESLGSRDRFSRQKSLLVWLSNMLAAESNTRGYTRTFVQYDRLLDEPEAVLQQVERSLDIALPRRSPEAGAEIKAFLDAALRHHRRGEPSEEGAPGLIQAAHDAFRRIGRGEPFDARQFDELGRELAQYREMTGEVIAELKAQARALKSELQDARTGWRRTTDELEAERAARAAESARSARLGRELVRTREGLSTRLQELDKELVRTREAFVADIARMSEDAETQRKLIASLEARATAAEAALEYISSRRWWRMLNWLRRAAGRDRGEKPRRPGWRWIANSGMRRRHDAEPG